MHWDMVKVSDYALVFIKCLEEGREKGRFSGGFLELMHKQLHGLELSACEIDIFGVVGNVEMGRADAMESFEYEDLTG